MPKTDKPTRRPTKSRDESDIKYILARIDGGLNISVQQLCIAREVGPTKVYADVNAGRLFIRKNGTRTYIEPDVARAYLAGEPMPRDAKGDSLSASSEHRVARVREYQKRRPRQASRR